MLATDKQNGPNLHRLKLKLINLLKEHMKFLALTTKLRTKMFHRINFYTSLVISVFK